MSARDELADLIADSIYRYTGVTTSSSKTMAQELLDAGYTKPRQVTTAEELDALPADSVVRDDKGFIYDKWQDEDEPEFTWWATSGDRRQYSTRRITLPATVIYSPEVRA